MSAVWPEILLCGLNISPTIEPVPLGLLVVGTRGLDLKNKDWPAFPSNEDPGADPSFFANSPLKIYCSDCGFVSGSIVAWSSVPFMPSFFCSAGFGVCCDEAVGKVNNDCILAKGAVCWKGCDGGWLTNMPSFGGSNCSALWAMRGIYYRRKRDVAQIKIWIIEASHVWYSNIYKRSRRSDQTILANPTAIQNQTTDYLHILTSLLCVPFALPSSVYPSSKRGMRYSDLAFPSISALRFF